MAWDAQSDFDRGWEDDADRDDRGEEAKSPWMSSSLRAFDDFLGTVGRSVAKAFDNSPEPEEEDTDRYYSDEVRRNSELNERLYALAEEFGRVLPEKREEDETLPDFTERLMDLAREWVERCQSDGIVDLDDQYQREYRLYSSSIEHQICVKSMELGRLIEQHDQAVNRRTGWPDYDTQACLSGKAICLLKGLIDAVGKTKRSIEKDTRQADLVNSGRISEDTWRDRSYRSDKVERQNRFGLDAAAEGFEPGFLGDLSDEVGHILEDALAPEKADIRKAISKKIRSMPRDMAMAIIERAVADGVIPQETADYLIFHYVRAR